ncbi:MAG TPA: phosphotransferase [Candidatus Polarisedimenticolia bacterium]|nr:phosphotransferase [Candidatus Polarisedimenticolia bacterium]
MRIEPELEVFLRGHFPEGTSWTALKGDASTRRFYRIHPPAPPTLILMAYPDPFLWQQFPLRGIHAHFQAIGVPVPRIERVFPEKGLVLVEDLGDTTLQSALLGDPSLERIPLYREAIDIIVLLQVRGTRELAEGAAPRQSALDEERFLWELDHFYKHFVLGYRAARPAPEEEALFRSFFRWLSASLDCPDRVLCHRDFQSRNLMVTPGGLRVIDYQDARMGPATYDLASLLKDSSLDLEGSLPEDGIRYFLSRREGLSEEEFREEFDRMTLQRNLKDLGTFGYQVHALEHEEYARYIPRTLEMVRENLLRHQRYHSLFPLFEKLLFSGSTG